MHMESFAIKIILVVDVDLKYMHALWNVVFAKLFPTLKLFPEEHFRFDVKRSLFNKNTIKRLFFLKKEICKIYRRHFKRRSKII